MNVITVKDEFMAALSAVGSDLDNWLDATYGRGCLVLVGIDEEKAPSEGECPCVEVDLPGYVVGDGVETREFYFSVIATICDESKVDHNNDLIIEYAGVGRRELFTGYVRDIFRAVIKDHAPNATIHEHEVDNGSVKSFPFFQAASLFRVTEPWTTGSSAY